jgi:hypothetical protein
MKRLGGAGLNSRIVFSGGGAKMGRFSCMVPMAPSLTTSSPSLDLMVFYWMEALEPCGEVPSGIPPRKCMWPLPWQPVYLY